MYMIIIMYFNIKSNLFFHFLLLICSLLLVEDVGIFFASLLRFFIMNNVLLVTCGCSFTGKTLFCIFEEKSVLVAILSMDLFRKALILFFSLFKSALAARNSYFNSLIEFLL